MTTQEITVPDIGNFTDVPVIEVHVQPGDVVAAEDPLVTLESDKATMDVPAPVAGTVTELRIAAGDTVSQGTVIMMVDTAGAAGTPPKERVREDATPAAEGPASYGSASGVYDRLEVVVPDIGSFTDVPVIEVHVRPGDTVAAEDPLVTLESDKATMDVPASSAGVLTEITVAVGDTVSAGQLLGYLQTSPAGQAAVPPAATSAAVPGPRLAGLPDPVPARRRVGQHRAVRHRDVREVNQT